ncbi:MAG TPA: histidine kinase [Candidatus Brevibacterium intestinavium]|nr:histidine kinase [Candidatus Brevibacterium intestinavium]
MSENTPENPQDQQPHGADPLEAQTPEAAAEPADREESFSAAAIVNAPPTTEIDETEAGSDRPTHHPSSQTPPDEAQSPTRAYGQPPASSASASPAGQDIPAASGPQPGQDIPAAPEHNPDAPVAATGSGPATNRAPGAYPTTGAQPAYAPQPAPGHPASSPGPQPPHAGQPAPGPHANPGPQANSPGPPNPRHPNPGHPSAGYSAPRHPAAGPGPQPGMATPNPQPPRRKKPRTEPVAYAPVTGSLPLSRDDVTEIPADGPITWSKRSTGIIGVANLVASAVLAVIWAWIPLSLLFTGIGGIFALGLGVLALLVWVLVQQGANIVERYRSELVYADRIPVPKIESSNREPGFGRFLHNRWLQVKSGAFWRSTAHHYIKMAFAAIIVGGTLAGICGSILGIFAAVNPHGVNTFFIGDNIAESARLGVAIGSVIVLASSVAILWFAPILDRALDRALLSPARTVALQAEVTELDRARMAGIEAAAAERLRIERDLHDGAQPRLVALTMTLGMAKSKVDSDPERAKELVSEAHAEAKGIVTELRQLARGIHPAVLTDRGLDAAVSALAGRSTIPIDVDVRLEGRIGREAEAVSYFVVAECLTNIAKHSGATRASVFIAPIETGVQIVVTDNGQGGARVDRTGRHTGIAGLIDRVEAARGTLNLTSPAGGPTTVVVEVPCAS